MAESGGQNDFKTSPLADALVERGLLRREQASLALRLAELSGLTFAEYLRQRNLVDAETLEELSLEFGEPVAPTPSPPQAPEEPPPSDVPRPRPPEPEEKVEPTINLVPPAVERARAAEPSEKVLASEIVEVARHTLVVCRAEADNADPHEVTATVNLAPAARTRLAVTCEASPQTVREGQETAVMVTVTITNTGSRVARRPRLSLRDLPPWFKVQGAVRVDTLETFPIDDELVLEDLETEKSITIAVHGIARP